MASATLTPAVAWAQRPKIVFLTINVSDVSNPEIKVEKDSLHFKGLGGADQKMYELKMKFLKEIDPEKTKYVVRPRDVQFALEKADDDGYWDRLLADKTKQHWLKIDFAKWKDEDDSDNEGGEGGGGGGGGQGGDLEEMMKNMGGLGGGMGGMGGMPGMGGMGGMPGMGGMGGMPGMGGMGGMPGMGGMGGMPPGMDMSALGGMMGGMGGKPGMDDLEGDSDDEDLPDLE